MYHYLFLVVAFICAIAVNWWIVSRYGYRRAKASTIAAFNSSVQRTIFWIKYPFVLMAYLERKRRRWKIIVPPVWLSPAGLMARDLELYVTDEGKEKIDVAFIDGLAKSRDETLRIVKKQLAISAVIFLFLFANYLAIETDVNIAGFSLKYAKGIPEGLMLISSLLSSYTLILQSNAYLLESAIKVLIGLVAPPELRELYEIQYFPHEHFGGYKPFNLPHITQSKITLALNKYAAIFFLVILVSAYLLYLYCYALLVIDMWQASRLGFWSKAIAAYMGLMGIGGFLFLAVSRMRLRYLDYTINQEFELLRQIAPERVNVRLQQVYGELNEDRQAMIRRGYLKQ